MTEYSPKKQKSSEEGTPGWVSWALIAILMTSGCWFIALPWLLAKLFGSDKKKTETRVPPLNRQAPAAQPARPATGVRTVSERAKNTTIGSLTKKPSDGTFSRFLQVLGGIVAVILGLTFAYDPLQDMFRAAFSAGDFFRLLSAAAIVAGGTALIVSGVLSGKAQKRFKKYLAVIGTARAVELAPLSVKLGIPLRTVKDDLQKMIDKGYFGRNAYLNEELGYLFADSEADDMLRSARVQAAEKAEQERATGMPELYTTILGQIHTANDRIPGEVMSAKIDELERVTREIFRTVEREPKKARKIDRFLNYYLPTTQKLLDAYAHYDEMERNGVTGENVRESMRSIENALDSVLEGFRNLLNSLYDSDTVDVKSDIDVLKQMMNADGRMAKSEFVMPSVAADELPAAEDGRLEFKMPEKTAEDVLCEL